MEGAGEARGLVEQGPPGGIYSNSLFADERGAATVFLPCGGELRPLGRVDFTVLPRVEMATIVHFG